MPDSSQVPTLVPFGGGLMSRSLSLLLAAALLAAAVAVAGLTDVGTDPASAAGDSCANAAFRNGASAALPDCRAYEMVSPVNKNGGDIVSRCDFRCNRTSLMQATPDGGKLTYSSFVSFGDAQSSLYSNQYIASRGSGGWSTHSINPPRHETLYSGFPSSVEAFYDLSIEAKGFSEDLSTLAWTDSSRPPLTSDAVEEVPNLYSRDNETDTYHWIAALGDASEGSDPGFGSEPEILGLSENGDHVVFIDPRALTADPVPPGGGSLLYDYTAGQVHLVSILPGGAAVRNASAGQAQAAGHETQTGRLVRNSVSRDGSRITWTVGTATGTIYQRIDNTETKKVSGITGPALAVYWGASSDGEEVLYQQPAGGGVENLYRVNVDDESSTLVGSWLTGNPAGAIGASEDLSYIYFVSNQVLAAGGTGGKPNLYLSHQGTTKLIATLSPVDVENASAVTNEEGKPSVGGYNIIASNPVRQAARVTPDGLGLAFQSVVSLTGYDNRDVKNNEPDLEVFVYDAATEELNCASCNPQGIRPNGKPLQLYNKADEDNPAANGTAPARRWTAAWLQTVESETYYPRDFSADGNRVFFNAFDGLALEDNNNQQDVYEWEAQGTGDCTQAGGCINLISTGESPVKSEFLDASTSGSDVFFTTRSSLVPQDPGLVDIYNAREGGGFEALAAGEAPCEGDACQALPTSPNDPTPASASYNGPGNVQQKAKKKHHKRHHKKHHGKHKKNKARANSRDARNATHGNG
jgi:hypothetical protein